ncbi:class I SAM-dependent methyltransferase [Streptomyces sp. XM4193]|uniref:class I SAM-dependent methyltransferase n=1 Tax=Streptomyces sp. XM4193 TaxID=2929782 RepID=UPI001FF89C6A|nr:class I SAM-dependent methyltransferase [Streptomyces sp. XM4193]MCK1798579.1 class I SAM-dependent methyltransferase [Streptomyces sp. XM4193]
MSEPLPPAAGHGVHPQPSGSGVEIFERHYAGEPGAGWEINRPQSTLVRLVEEGALRGRVLDVGCGSGDNAVLAAEHGLETTGVDAAPSAITLARGKARERGLDVRFLEWDALRLDTLGEQFDTLVDVGLFHCFAPQDRPLLARSMASVTVPGGRCHLMCFSDRQPGTWGPQRVPEQALRDAFTGAGWRVDTLEPAELDVAFDPGVAQAWFAVMTRV